MKGRPENSFLEQFSERFMDHVRQVCTFAKLIPGFKCLHHDDQVTLLKSCVFEVLLVRLAGLFENQVRIRRRCLQRSTEAGFSCFGRSLSLGLSYNLSFCQQRKLLLLPKLR